jgi:hypothetical protein
VPVRVSLAVTGSPRVFVPYSFPGGDPDIPRAAGASMRSLDACCRPSRHLAYTSWSTATPCPARSATSVEGQSAVEPGRHRRVAKVVRA